MTPGRTRRTKAPARSSRQRQSASQQRQRLIDACISALHLYGPSRTTVAKVVAIARLSPGIVRFYFNSKAAMLVASLRFLAMEFEQRVVEPVGQLRDTPALALQKLVELYLDPEIASARKVSVWYAFWGESTARREYQEICGLKDERFAILVHELIGRMIGESGQRHLNSDAIALGLIGALEVLWQGITFQSEDDVDRADARRRCLAYLASVFPGYFPSASAAADWRRLPGDARHALEIRRCFTGAWQLVGRASELARSGDFLTIGLAAARVLALRDNQSLRAFHNNCPHQPHALVRERRGRLTGHIACHVHQLDFGLDGRSRGGTGPGLEPLELAVDAGFVFAGDGADPRPQLLPDGRFARLKAAGAAGEFAELELACDWKLLLEQLLLHRLREGESIGGPLAHAEATLAVDEPGRTMRWRAAIAGGECWSARRLFSVGGARLELERHYVWPNVLIEWRADGCRALQVLPLAAGRCRLQSFDYAWSDAGEEARARHFLWRRLDRSMLRLDTELAASTQAGLDVPGYAARGDAPVPRAVVAFRAWLGAALDAR
jgi:TetR/AcrR family transcriptional regulator, transcriptional repressor of bet genes